jgi:hypothetical protein
MAGVAIRWVGFVFLLATGLCGSGSGDPLSPVAVALGVGLVVIGKLWPRGDLPPGLTVEAPSRATRVPTIDLRKARAADGQST